MTKSLAWRRLQRARAHTHMHAHLTDGGRRVGERERRADQAAARGEGRNHQTHGRVLRCGYQAAAGVAWCGVGWRGVVWCGVVWCGVYVGLHGSR